MRRGALAVVERDLKLRGFAQATIRRALAVGKRFLAFGRKPLANVKPADLVAYLARRSGEGIAPGSQAHELTNLRAIFRALVAAEVVPTDPTEGLAVRFVDRPREFVLSLDMVMRLLATSLDESAYIRWPNLAKALVLRDRAVLELLYALGLRSSEVAAMKVVDLQLGEGELLVRRAKRGESRALPLPPAAVRQLRRYFEEARPKLVRLDGRDQGAFLLSFRGCPLTNVRVHEIVSRLGARAGFHLYPHAFRRTLATHLVGAGVCVEAVRQLLGHRHLTATQDYVMIDREERRRAVETLAL